MSVQTYNGPIYTAISIPTRYHETLSAQPVARVLELRASFWVVAIYARWSSLLQQTKSNRYEKIQSQEICPGHWEYVLIVALVYVGIVTKWTLDTYEQPDPISVCFFRLFMISDWSSLVWALHVWRKIFRQCCFGLCSELGVRLTGYIHSLK